MKCEHCPALLREGYEYPEEYCVLGEDEREFNDGSIGCSRKSIDKIERDLKIATELDTKAFAEECGRMVEFLEQEDSLKDKLKGECQL